jgi:hypothetical protein
LGGEEETLQAGDPENLGNFWIYLLKSEISPLSLGGLGSIDAKMNEGRGGIGNGGCVEADGPTVCLNQLSDCVSEFSDSDSIHSAV